MLPASVQMASRLCHSLKLQNNKSARAAKILYPFLLNHAKAFKKHYTERLFFTF